MGATISALLVGCAASAGSPGESAASASGEPTLAASPSSMPASVPLYAATEGGHLAVLTGRLVVDGPCLLLVDGAGEMESVAWPSPGTAWDPSTGTISVGGVEATVGDTVSLVGGEGNGLLWNDKDWVAAPAPGCVTEQLWIVYQMLETPS